MTEPMYTREAILARVRASERAIAKRWDRAHMLGVVIGIPGFALGVGGGWWAVHDGRALSALIHGTGIGVSVCILELVALARWRHRTLHSVMRLPYDVPTITDVKEGATMSDLEKFK